MTWIKFKSLFFRLDGEYNFWVLRKGMFCQCFIKMHKSLQEVLFKAENNLVKRWIQSVHGEIDFGHISDDASTVSCSHTFTVTGNQFTTVSCILFLNIF